jgi:ABC-type microcin C transport system duplicated ATPase subunit YejF
MCALSGYVIMRKDGDIAGDGATRDVFEAPAPDHTKA